MTVSRRTMATTIALVILVSQFPMQTMAGEGLQGKNLPVVNDLESGVGSLIGHFLGGGKELDGQIDSVTVTRDDARRVELRVRYTGFEGGKIWADALDAQKRKQRQIQSEPIVLEQDAQEAALFLEVDPNWDWDSLSSAFVSVNVGLPHRSTPGVVRTYALGKTWHAPPGSGGSHVAEPEQEPVSTDALVLDPIPLGDTPLGNVAPPPSQPPTGGGNSAGGANTGGGTVMNPGNYKVNTNVLMALQPKVDLYTLAASAQWSNGAVQLPFNGSPSDARGFVIAHATKPLNDGKSYNRVLQAHPQWKDNGRINGTYAFTMPANASTLEVGLGFLRGANGSDGVTFRVQCRSGSRSFTLLNERVRNNQVVQKKLAIPNELKGQSVRLFLTVFAGASSGQDWSAWIYPRIN